jgi:enterochelin esterase-like enzyme
MSHVSDIDLLSGPLPVTVTIMTIIAALFLLYRRSRRWPIIVLVTAAISAVLAWLINLFEVHVMGISAYDLPPEVIVSIGAGVFAILLALLHVVLSRWWKKILAPLAAIVVIVAAAMQVNSYYGAYLTVGDLTGTTTTDYQSLPHSALKKNGHILPGVKPGDPAAAHWKRPAGLPSKGSIYTAEIPGKTSGFTARTAYVYLPPAYKAKQRVPLPVLVLITGQPGSPAQWTSAGGIQKTMDDYAARHNGLAPVVVMPDVNGSQEGNTMCMDSAIARADTYLSKDIPAWIKDNLTVDPDPARWVIGGFSFGGTCSLQMAALHPEIFPNAIVMSGEQEPAISAKRETTIQEAFHGNTAEFVARTPLSVLAHRTYSHSAVYFAAGAQDQRFTGYMVTTSTAAKKAGMTVTRVGVPGVGHSWKVPATILGPALDWHSKRLGLVP